jgi:D-beta-D-heptose 7-phosphate kinase/D-beta-D-heptose 1-phosphate adenosyltransferase
MAAELAPLAASVETDRHVVLTTAGQRPQRMASEKVVANLEQLAECVTSYKRQGRRVVLTNGCFDILHRGHVTLLEQARALGDVLVVAVNTDEGVQRLKGSGRPVNALADRMAVLAALGCVDHVVAFGEDTPVEVIRALRPDVFVKGGDYTRERLPEAALVEELGGIVRILPYVENHSTTRLLERIQHF